MPTIKLYKPLPHQDAVHRAITHHLDTMQRGTDEFQRIFVACSPRQVGKSALCLNELIRFGFLYNEGTSIYITPALGLARKVYNDLIRVASGLIRSKNVADLAVTFVNGSKVYFRSAEQRDSLRGLTVKKGILIIDECAFIRNDVYHEIIAPFVDFYKELTLMVSTPKFKTGFFYDTYVRNSKTGYAFNFSNFDLSAIRSQAKLAGLKDTVPAQVFRSEYMGQFLDAESSVFGLFAKNILNHTPAYKELYWGLDFASGSGNDYTVLTAINEEAEMVYMWRVNDMPPVEQANKIVSILEKFKPFTKKINAEGNAIGKIYLDLLKQNGTQVTEFTTTNDSKRRMVENMQVAFEQDKIKIMNDFALVNELSFYEQKVNPTTNRVSYNAPPGMHDDCVMSLLLAYEALTNKGEYKYFIV